MTLDYFLSLTKSFAHSFNHLIQMKSELQIKCSLLLLFWLGIAPAYSQKTAPAQGRAVIYFEPASDVIIRLDSALWKQSKQPVLLKEGRHIIKAWAPTKQLFVDTFFVQPGKTSIVAKRLQPTEAYRTYREQINSYHVKKAIFVYIPLPFTLLYSGFMAIKYSSNKKLMNQHLENAKTEAGNYAKQGPDAATAKALQAYKTEKDSYEGYRKRNNYLAVVACITIPAEIAATAVLYYFSKRIVRPAAYSETPLLSFNSFGIKSDYHTSCSMAIVLNINR